MSKKALALFGVVAWVGGITALYLVANREPDRLGERFRVGFLPVT
jgi:hypothetical protein